MNIVIVGDGKVGYALSVQLILEGHDITVIDNNQKALDSTLETLDVMCIHGNGATRDVQIEAGVPNADLLIAATSTDELNMICCLTAKYLGVKDTIARIRDPEYSKHLNILKEQYGLSMIINPELEAAREISRVIKFPPALKVDTFSKGRVELVELKLQNDSHITDKRLMDINFKPGLKVLVCAVDRDGDITIPNGDFVLNKGDKIHITGDRYNISEFIHSIGDFKQNIRSLIIVGGGHIGYYLGAMLNDKRYQLKIIERDAGRCAELCELLPRAIIINGDGSNMELLESEGLDKVDAFISLTGMDEENIVMSMVACHKKIPKVITKVNRFNYLGILDQMGINSVVSPKMTTAVQITQYVRAMQNTVGSKINTLYKLVGGKAEALEFTALKDMQYQGIPLQRLRIRKNLLISTIIRAAKVIIPDGETHVQEGDSVVVITAGGRRLDDLNDIFEDRQDAGFFK